MRRRIGRPSIPGVVFYSVLVVALIVGLVIGGGTGDTIVAISAAVIALAIFGTVGIGKAIGDYQNRRGPWQS
jgi:hypothetical protein